ncbi:MAG TPA: hypothetical protein VJ960_09280 [Oceanipulchritudo sp.]|nr:hypothetical protein [Oceanipulchritudo sp.]
MKPFLSQFLSTLALFLPLNSLMAETVYSEEFNTAESASNWTGEPTWNESTGNPEGSLIVSNNIQPTNRNFTVEIPLELPEDTNLTVSFDALSLKNFAGVFHFYAEPEGFPQYYINFNVETLINATTWSPLEFKVEDVPADASFLILRFEIITGAVQEADIAVAIDNLTVTGPTIDPEGTWKGLSLVDGFWVQNVGQMGWIHVEFEPWIWSASLDEWVFLPEGSEPGVSGIWYYMPPSE